MRVRATSISKRRGEEGVVVLLVAVVLLFIVAAMAALAIDVTTIYTARSEAQQAADGAALAGARALANSGMTSSPADTTLAANAEILATTIAQQVGQNNSVGGRRLNAGEVIVSFPNIASPDFGENPHVMVQVTRTDLPTFFARIWGPSTATVGASATAEAYNPSGRNATLGASPPVAPTCVKPWVLPNIDPSLGPGNTIFNAATGAITNPALLGRTDATGAFRTRCNNCGNPTGLAPSAWRFYPADPSSFPVPTSALPACTVLLNPYQNSIAGCVQTPVSCNSTVNLDHTTSPNLHLQAAQAVNCMNHSAAPTPDGGDIVINNPALTPGQPFQFQAGDGNPAAGATNPDIIVSDSLITVPVYDSTAGAPTTNPVTVIGFVQLFVSPDGAAVPVTGINTGHINTTIVNLVGCGTNATGQPILGHGSSPVAVRLIAAQ